MTARSQEAPQAPPVPTVVQTLLLLVAITVGTAAYLGLNAALGTQEVWAGFLFLFYWAGIQKVDFSLFPSSVAGAFAGLLLGLALQQLGARFGTPGLVAFLGLIFVVLFLFLRGQLRVAINDATMLMLTAATIGHVQMHADFQGMFTSLAIAVVFFGALFWGLNRMQARKSLPEPTPADGLEALSLD
jgi:hypothetical protein